MPLSEVINVSRYEDPEWMEFHKGLEAFSTDKHVFKHTEGEIYRKGWEWTHCIYGLSKLGAITPDARALGVGAGREPVIFWLAESVKEVVATDLYRNPGILGRVLPWGNEAPSAILKSADRYSPKPIRKDRIRFENANGTKLPYPDNTFDLCWSLSSIEHFGGHEASRKAVQEMGRVTRPGGIVCIATEYLLLPELTHKEFFNKQEIEEYLIGASPNLSLVDGMSWDLPPTEFLIDQICARSRGKHRRRRHVIMNSGTHQWTSFMLFFRKK